MQIRPVDFDSSLTQNVIMQDVREIFPEVQSEVLTGGFFKTDMFVPS